MPDITWPELPDPSKYVTMANGVVSMPLSYWMDLTRYIIDMEAAREIVEFSHHGSNN